MTEDKNPVLEAWAQAGQVEPIVRNAIERGLLDATQASAFRHYLSVTMKDPVLWRDAFLAYVTGLATAKEE